MSKKITLIVILLTCCGFFISNAQQTATINCRSTAGGAGEVSSSGTITDPLTGNINITTTTEGYAVFDISSVPANATVVSVSLVFYEARLSTGTGTNPTRITGGVGNWSTQSGTTLYSTISAATSLSTTAWSTSATAASRTVALNAAATTLVQGNLGGTISLGFYITGTGTRTYTIAGETSANPPQLVVTYKIFAAPKYASIPYTQNFESWVNFNDNLDVPDSNWTNMPPTGDESWRRNDQGVSNGGWTPNTYADQYVAPQGSYYARFNIWANYTTGTLDLHLNCSSGGSSKQVSFFYVNKESDNMTLSLSVDSGKTFTLLNTYSTTNTWTQFNVPFTSNAKGTVLRFAATSNYANYDMGLDNLTVSSLSSCSGAPVQEIASPSKAFILPCNATQTFTLSGNNIGVGGITYQWQQSTNGITFTPISGATSASYTGSFSSNAYINCVITCTGSGQSVTTNVDTVVAGQGYYPVTVGNPYVQGFEDTWRSSCATNDAPDVYWLSSPATGQNSWRRDDDGASAGWTSPSQYGFTPAGSNANGASSTHSARFHSSYNWDDSGFLYLYLDLSASGSKQISYDYVNQYGGTGGIKVSLSTTGLNGTFTELDNITRSATWQTRTVTTSATSSTCVLRFKGVGDYNSDFHIDNVTVAVIAPCNGTPAAAVASPKKVSLTLCNPIQKFTLSNNYLGITGLTYQWRESFDGINFTPIPGATSNSLTDTFNGGTTYINCLVTCTATGQSTPSSTDTVIVAAPSYAVVTLGNPYLQGFENAWIDKCGTRDVADNYWLNTPGTGNNSWRRDDDGSAASWSSPNSNSYSPVGSNVNSGSSSHSARFHNSYNNNRGGTMDLYLDLSASGGKQIAYDYINGSTGGNYVKVLLSTNSTAGPFVQIDSLSTSATWKRYSVITTTTSSKCVVRFLAYGDNNAFDIGLDNIAVTVLTLIPCSGPPTATNAVPAKVTLTACNTSQAFSLSTNYSGTTGITYQWQQSTNGINFTPISGATNSTYTGSFAPGTTYVNCVVKCDNTNNSITSSTDTVIVLPQAYASLPYVQNFDKVWANGCGTDNDVPDSNWTNALATVIPSNSTGWRRSDYALWGQVTEYQPCPTGNYCGMFRTGGTSASSGPASINMDLHLNCSASPGMQKMTFYYNNDDRGNPNNNLDSLTVFVSTNGVAGPFTRLAKLTSTTDWILNTITFTSSSAQTIVRFTGNAAFGFNNSDIAIDALNVSTLIDCSGTPAATNATPSKVNLSACNPSQVFTLSNNYAGLNGITYQWQQSTNGTNFTPIPGATGSTYTGSFSNSVYINCVVTCTNTSLSATSGTDTVIVAPQSYASLPYTQDFETWIDVCGTDKDAPDNYWDNSNAASLTSQDKGWRRSDYTAWTTGAGGFTPYPSGSYSARFHTNGTSGSNAADSNTFNLYLNCANFIGDKTMTFYYMNNGGSDYMNLYMSIDSGATFTPLRSYTTTSSAWKKDTVTLASNSPKTIIRFTGTTVYGNNGNGDIGVDLIQIYVCNGQAGIKANGALSFCEGDSVLLYADTATINNTYQWLKDGNMIGGATASTYIARQAGVYTVALDNPAHCPDTSSAATVTITAPMPIIIETTGKELTTGTYASYQWYLNGQPISGATSQTYKPTVDGIYYVVVDSSGCKGQSADHTSSGVSVSTQQSMLQFVKLYPDPNTGSFIVKGSLNSVAKKQVFFEVTDVVGRVVYRADELYDNGIWEKHIVLTNTIADGMYLLHINVNGQKEVIKFMVNR